jgi:type IV pilus assembly protein PilX
MLTCTHIQYRNYAAQRGVALVIALVLLVVLSVLATLSVRNATSSEGVSGNARLSQLANQSAETALRYCEEATINLINAGPAVYAFSTPASAATASLVISNVLDYVSTGTPTSQVTANWDSATAVGPLILPLSSVNPSGVSSTFARPPECMIERLSPLGSATYSSTFTITARGFGPEVTAANATRSAPQGSEVWLQSTIELN